MDPIEIPITDELDLHTFHPRDLPDLLVDYIEACRQKNIFAVRIIHGKGKGILKKRLQSLLKKHPLVASFKDAPPEAGGWGATLVELKQD
jgi:DNA-nicking Smr family endonuclease